MTQAAAKLNELAASFLACFADVSAAREGLRVLRPFPAHLTTITMTGTLRLHDAPEEVLDAIEMGLGMMPEMGEASEFKLVRGRRTEPATDPRRRPKRPFSNSVMLRHCDTAVKSNQCVKLFNNSSIQVAGCPSAIDFACTVMDLAAFAERLGLQGPMVLEDCETQMINVNVAVHLREGGAPLALRMDRLAEHPAWRGLDVFYDPELGPGLKVRCPAPAPEPAGACTVTCQIFRSGIVCFKGAKRPEHVALAYADVMARLDAAAADPGVLAAADPGDKRLRTTTSKQVYVQCDGYPRNSLLSCTLFSGDGAPADPADPPE